MLGGSESQGVTRHRVSHLAPWEAKCRESVLDSQDAWLSPTSQPWELSCSGLSSNVMLVLFQLSMATSLNRPNRLAQRRYPTQPWWEEPHIPGWALEAHPLRGSPFLISPPLCHVGAPKRVVLSYWLHWARRRQGVRASQDTAQSSLFRLALHDGNYSPDGKAGYKSQLEVSRMPWWL